MSLIRGQQFILKTQQLLEAIMTSILYMITVSSFGIPLAFIVTIFLIEQIDSLYRVFQEALVRDMFSISFLSVPYTMILLNALANTPKSSFQIYSVGVLSLIISMLTSFYCLRTKIKINYFKTTTNHVHSRFLN